ncbi:hypothetical protein MMC21_006386 [Puttea exsequens]|nr:hypothetical protein [Puttea exsequens]
MTPTTAAHRSAKLLAAEMIVALELDEGAGPLLVVLAAVDVAAALEELEELDELEELEVLESVGRLMVVLRWRAVPVAAEAPEPTAPVPAAAAEVGVAVVLLALRLEAVTTLEPALALLPEEPPPMTLPDDGLLVVTDEPALHTALPEAVAVPEELPPVREIMPV